MGQLISPDKTPIVGLLETIPATALVASWERLPNGKLEPTYGGGSTVHWDDQTPGLYTRWMAVDEDGGQWLLDTCTFVEKDEEDTCSKCGCDLTNPSAAGAEDGICGECIDGDK